MVHEIIQCSVLVYVDNYTTPLSLCFCLLSSPSSLPSLSLPTGVLSRSLPTSQYRAHALRCEV